MSTSNFLQIKPNGLNLPGNSSNVSASAGDLSYNSTLNKFSAYATVADYLVLETATQTLTNKTLTGNTASNLVSASGVLVLNTAGTITVPNSTDTLVAAALPQTLTNKTIDASVNTLSNITNSNLSGSAAVSNANLASMAANTLKGNNTGSPSVPSDLTLSELASMLGYITSLSGDGTTSGSGAATFTLDTVNSDVGSFGSSTAIPTITVNGKGLVTAVSVNAVIAPAGTLTGTTLASNVVTSSLTSVGIVTSGTWNATTVDVPHGGTGQTSLTSHAVLVGNGTSSVTQVSPGSSGLIFASNGPSVDPSFQFIPGINLKAPTCQVLTSGTSLTYTTPSSPSPLYLKVQMVGGGGGGGSGGTTGSVGGDTSFGTSLLFAGGGSGGTVAAAGGNGGAASLGSGPIGIALSGGSGNGAGAPDFQNNQFHAAGGGASSPFGGAGGAGAPDDTPGHDAIANTGSGGGGGGVISPTSGAEFCPGGGGAGGYVDAMIISPSSTYSYSVGAGGSGGSAGGGTDAGGSGGSGLIIVWEYYQ